MLSFLEDSHPLSKWLGQRNLARQYDYMNTSFLLWQNEARPKPSLNFLCDLNFYAVHGLSPRPGVFRHRFNCNVKINGSPHIPPGYEQVEALMADFLVKLHKMYDTDLPTEIAAYALWRLNWIHPFAQGNGRTSRAICYFLICMKYDVWFPGTPVHELIRQNRDEYCDLLKAADQTVDGDGMADLSNITAFLDRLMEEQIASVPELA